MSQPTLQELSEKKVLEQILQSDNSDADFASLEPRVQRLLFSRLRIENERLLEVDKRWRALKHRCPSTDVEIYVNSNNHSNAEAEDENEDEYEDEEDRYSEQNEFLQKWSYLVKDAHESKDGGRENTTRSAGNSAGVKADEEEGKDPETGCDLQWGKYNLIADSWDSDIRVCLHKPSRCCCDVNNHGKARRVSSQLLLYRLTVMFGMPPPREMDGYKMCWEVRLQYSDGASVLDLFDYKGAASLNFSGTSKASDDALKLLKHLFGIKCLHTYDGIVAGTKA